ncbi:MAG TPA: tetratricopeptide repeat protein [Candidatus Dormibacteraeota bacterium]|nr:tetratricopeptide repeat protein [Candidatus Dormibacteraeota bacterium]
MNGTLFDQYKAALRRGHLAALAGNLDEALESYAAAERLVPDRALPVASQGTVLHRLDRWPEAAAAFERALHLAPDDEATLRARAVAREARGLRSGAASDFERLAFVLDVAGRSTDAAEAARHAATLEPSPARDALVRRLAGAGDPRLDPQPSDVVAVDASARDDLGHAEPVQDAEPVADAAPEPESEASSDADEPPVPSTGLAVYVPQLEHELGALGDRPDAISAALAARLAELGTQPAWVDMEDSPIRAAIGDLGPDGQSWPPVDLPSPPPPPIVGPPPDPESLLAEASTLLAAVDLHGARDLMLTAAMVHRAAGRLDAALEICLQLLTTSPGDPQVHLAIANLQLDRGWTALATEKIELLLRLTSLTGDTQAEADVHGLASERLRDEPVSSAGAR